MKKLVQSRCKATKQAKELHYLIMPLHSYEINGIYLSTGPPTHSDIDV